MSKVFRSFAAAVFAFSLLAIFSAPPATAQTSSTAVTALTKQLSHVQLAITGAPFITPAVTGTNYLGTTITQKPSSTTGVVANLRYTHSPYIGFEFNFGYARYTENYTCLASSTYCKESVPLGPCSGNVSASTVCPAYVFGGAQVSPREYTVGYVVHPPKVLGFDTFAAAGVGTTAFVPTRYGGQNLPEQARATYYYNVGLEKSLFSPHFGLRAQVRQTFYKAPDLLENYLTINQHSTTFQPGFGFYLKF